MGKFPCWQWPVLSYRAASRSQQGQQLFCLREHISREIREINKVCFEDSAQRERRAPFKAQWQDYSLSMRWAGNQTVSKQNSQKLPDYLSLQARFSFCFLSIWMNWMAVKIIALVLTAVWFVSLTTGESPNAGFRDRTTDQTAKSAGRHSRKEVKSVEGKDVTIAHAVRLSLLRNDLLRLGSNSALFIRQVQSVLRNVL